ncbi:type III-A CRISPR-associated protein Csm2 [Caviibacterium pharyngocola]|uniref:CRISPR system Cms protein Csm2 n=1 Tax=Caviibacterium pharyngocola TaxID=28159 RepID=A0A2M8RU54_9PAST|nr:type III-A CRISPR-associated protein Csm2 [Caviibacterium pharyngocola]PJG82419.1 type III-A CRISPR-associated protein Csm2 [Caviibacterium pharyngocola]
MNVSQIKLGAGNRPRDLFSTLAEEFAKSIKHNAGRANKPAQLRKFYDELCMWNDRVQQATNRGKTYQELEPFIKMLKAKVAYALGRELVNKNFSDIFNRTMDEIKSAETLKEGKLFMEAVMGYCKLYE